MSDAFARTRGLRGVCILTVHFADQPEMLPIAIASFNRRPRERYHFIARSRSASRFIAAIEGSVTCSFPRTIRTCGGGRGSLCPSVRIVDGGVMVLGVKIGAGMGVALEVGCGVGVLVGPILGVSVLLGVGVLVGSGVKVSVKVVGPRA